MVSTPYPPSLNTKQQEGCTIKPALLSPPQLEYSNTTTTLTPPQPVHTTPPQCKKILTPYFFSKSPNLFSQTTPASDPLRRSAPVLVPPGPGIIPCQGAMGTTAMWPPPPPSMASDTTSASPRDPTSARRWPGPRTQHTKSGTTLGSKVNPRSTSMVYYAYPFLRRMYRTSAHGIPCEQGDNALHQDFD